MVEPALSSKQNVPRTLRIAAALRAVAAAACFDAVANALDASSPPSFVFMLLDGALVLPVCPARRPTAAG